MRLSKNSEVKRSYLVFFSFLPLAGPPPPLEESSPAPGAIPTSIVRVLEKERHTGKVKQVMVKKSKNTWL